MYRSMYINGVILYRTLYNIKKGCISKGVISRVFVRVVEQVVVQV